MDKSPSDIVEIFTDGSCHSQWRAGAWVAIILHQHHQTVLSGAGANTTHNRMELLAVIKAMAFIKENRQDANVCIYTDSQYVAFLPARKQRLLSHSFITRSGAKLANLDLITEFYQYSDNKKIRIGKVKAHRKKNFHTNYNIEADILARQLVREKVKWITANL